LSDEDDEEPAAESDEAFDSDEDEAPKKRGAKVRSSFLLFPPLHKLTLYRVRISQKAGKKAPPKKKAKTSK
jgi:hypothetical protein